MSGSKYYRFTIMWLMRELFCMQPSVRDLSRYRLERAEEDIRTA